MREPYQHMEEDVRDQLDQLAIIYVMIVAVITVACALMTILVGGSQCCCVRACENTSFSQVSVSLLCRSRLM